MDMTHFTRRQTLAAAGALIAAPLLRGHASAQAWPTKTIRIVTGFAAGGLVDISARTYGEFIQGATGQTVIVENKTGAAGALAATEVARSAPDGHTLLFTINSAMTVSRVLYKNLGYDPDKDFSLISYMPTGNVVGFVRSDLGIRNLKELVEYARKNPVSAGTSGPGSFTHMSIVEINKFYNLKIEPVHYRGEALAMQALHTGELQMMIGTFPGAQLPLKAGTARPFAVTGEKRSKRLPDVATFYEQGLTSEAFRLTSYLCVVAPAGLPEPIAQRLSDLFVQAGTSDKVQKFMDIQGMDEPAKGRAAFRQIYDREGPVWIKLAKDLNLAPI
jgi:tripartite-type tricarboxylate transporter receptor subunit TctC